MIDGPKCLRPIPGEVTWSQSRACELLIGTFKVSLDRIGSPHSQHLGTRHFRKVWTIRSVALMDPAENDGHARDRRDGNLE